MSLLHGNVSRGMFSGLWPGFDPDEVPITSVTNGVHAPTWVAPEVFRLGARQIGAERTEDALTGAAPNAGTRSRRSPTRRSDLRRDLREQLVVRYGSGCTRPGGTGVRTAELGWIDGVLDPTCSRSDSPGVCPRTSG